MLSTPYIPNRLITLVLMYLRGIIGYFYFASLHVSLPESQDQCISRTTDLTRQNTIKDTQVSLLLPEYFCCPLYICSFRSVKVLKNQCVYNINYKSVCL